MLGQRFQAGLTPNFPTPPFGAEGPQECITEEAAVIAPRGKPLRVDVVVGEDEVVAQGAPVARLHHDPAIALVAPMAARVAAIRLKPGRRLTEIVLFHEAGGDRQTFPAGSVGSEEEARSLMQVAGLWTRLRRRPFGGLPASSERPAAIVVMAADTRPHAPDPLASVRADWAHFREGLWALHLMTDGPLFVCKARSERLGGELDAIGAERMRVVDVGPRHPQGLPGIQIHRLFPAGIDAPVWDIHAEDVAHLGALLLTGMVPATVTVSVAGPALTASRVVRCQPGADLRGLTFDHVEPGRHTLLSGSPLEGTPSQWLLPRERQVSVMRQAAERRPVHWFRAALTRSALPRAVIPTAALDQALGGGLPGPAVVRALASGDEEAIVRFGLLSLLEEDLALANYVVGGDPDLMAMLGAMLERIEAEMAA